MQKVIYANFGEKFKTPLKDVNELLSEGWKVVMMQPFSQNVSVSAVKGGLPLTESGAYGMVFVLENE